MSILNAIQPNIDLYLPFNEGSGSTAYDYSGNANNGTITDATYSKIQDGSYALDFNGTSAELDIGTVPTIGTGNYSCVIWYNTDTEDGTVRKIFDIGASGTATAFGSYVYNGEIRAGFSSSAITNAKTTTTTNEWHMIAVVISGGNTITLYHDGELVGIDTVSYNIGTTYNLLGYYTAQYFSGMIRMPMYFDTNISAELIKKIYQETYIN